MGTNDDSGCVKLSTIGSSGVNRCVLAALVELLGSCLACDRSIADDIDDVLVVYIVDKGWRGGECQTYSQAQRGEVRSRVMLDVLGFRYGE